MARKLVSFSGAARAAQAVTDAAPPPWWRERRLRAQDGEISGVVDDFAILIPGNPSTLVVGIDNSWMPVDHKDLREALAVLDPRVGEHITVRCLGRKGRDPYRYEVEVEGRLWSSD